MNDTERPAAPPPARPAATILLLRDGDQGMEVFMVVRHQQIDFASGALVFPGGKLAAGDSDARVSRRCLGAEKLSPEHTALRVGAIREAFEECGVLLAVAGTEQTPIGHERLAALGRRYRQPLDRGELGIADLLESEDLYLDCGALLPFAHWITPGFMHKRFDTHFFLAVAPSEQVALHDGREAVDSVWIRPGDALHQASAGTRTLVPATRLNVEKLGRSTTVADALAAARSAPIVTVEPRVMEGREGRWLSIPAEADYGTTEFSFP